MGSKRIGLARTAKLIENLKRELALGGNTVLVGHKAKVDNTTLNTGSAVTTTLTRAQSGTHFNINGTDDIVVNMPALSTSNVGVKYDFLVTTAVGGGKTATFVLPGSGVSDWVGNLMLSSTGAVTIDNAGDTLTLIATSGIGSRVSLVCVSDDGTNSKWRADVVSDLQATVG